MTYRHVQIDDDNEVCGVSFLNEITNSETVKYIPDETITLGMIYNETTNTFSNKEISPEEVEIKNILNRLNEIDTILTKPRTSYELLLQIPETIVFAQGLYSEAEELRGRLNILSATS